MNKAPLFRDGLRKNPDILNRECAASDPGRNLGAANETAAGWGDLAGSPFSFPVTVSH
jgi:hypothetical protein